MEVLRIVDICQNFHCLPRAGGLFDQDPYWVAIFSMVLAAQAEKEHHTSQQVNQEVANASGH